MQRSVHFFWMARARARPFWSPARASTHQAQAPPPPLPATPPLGLATRPARRRYEGPGPHRDGLEPQQCSDRSRGQQREQLWQQPRRLARVEHQGVEANRHEGGDHGDTHVLVQRAAGLRCAAAPENVDRNDRKEGNRGARACGCWSARLGQAARAGTPIRKMKLCAGRPTWQSGGSTPVSVPNVYLWRCAAIRRHP